MPLTHQDLRTLKGGLDARRAKEADIEYWIYIGPEGSSGLHRARPPHSSTSRVIGSSLGGRTFRPGSVVPVGSHSGRPGKFIIGGPPPGQRGASAFAAQVLAPGDMPLVTLEEPPPTPEVLVCPTSGVTGKAYLGAYARYFPSKELYALAYSDETYVSQLALKTHTFDGGSARFSARVESGPAEYIVGAGKDSTWMVFSWDVASNTLYLVDSGSTGNIIGPVVNGTTIYFCVVSGSNLNLYSSSVGSTSKSLVNTTTDSDIDWTSNPRSMATMGASSVLVQGYDSTRAVGDRGVWTDAVNGTARLATFDEDRRWLNVGQKTGVDAVSWNLWSATDELQSLDSSGATTTLASTVVWPGLNAGFAVSPNGSEIAWYPQSSGPTPSTIFRVEIRDWTSLEGCTINGTGQVEYIDALPFTLPDVMLPRD